MSQSSENEWFYHSSTAGRNPSGITLLQLKQLISDHKLRSNSQIWHPTYVPHWTPLKLLNKNIQKLLNINYYKTKSKQTPNDRNHRNRRDKTNRDHITSHSHSRSKHHHRKHRAPMKSPRYKEKTMIYARSTSDLHSSQSDSTPTVSGSSTIMYDYNTKQRSKSKSNKIATIHKRTDSDPIPRDNRPSGFILKSILNKKSKSIPFELMNNHKSSSDCDSDHRNIRKVSMGSDITIPPPFPMDNISPDTSFRYNAPRKNSGSFLDISSIAPISELARNFVSNRSHLEEKYENDDNHSIKQNLFNSRSKTSASATFYPNKQKKKKRSKTMKETRHITRITKKGRVSIKRSIENNKKTPKGPHIERERTAPIPNVTLKQFMSEYNDTHRERLRDKLNATKKLYNEYNVKSLAIEKNHFHREHTYKKNELYLKERFIEKQIQVYTKGIAIINNNMKSSKDLKEYITSNLDQTQDKKTQRALLRQRNEILKKEMNEYMKFDSILNKTTAEMMDDVSKQNKSMLMLRKELQEKIQDISSILESESSAMDLQYNEIESKKQTLLEIPRNSLSSEGDTKLDFDELHDPLYTLYKDVTQQRSEWFADRTNIREQCMIHRMFWKKYTQWMSLEGRMDEMRKREKQQHKYTKKLRNEMNDMMENEKMDRFQLQINTKQALIHAKQEALKEKQDTLKDLQRILRKYKVSVAAMNRENDEMVASNDEMHEKIQRASEKRYESLIHSNKIDPEMKHYLMERKKAVRSQRSTLEQLWREMNEKRYKLKSLQFETKHIKQEQTDDGTFIDLDNEDISDRSDDDDDDTDNERLQYDLKLEQQQINELKEKLEKKKQEMNKIDMEIEQKQQIKTNHDKSLELVQKAYDDINETYKELNEKIDRLNDERHDKFKQMFDGILSASNKVSNIGEFKLKQQASAHANMEVDEDKEDESKNNINIIVRGEINGENEEKSSEISGHHEPGTTPPKYDKYNDTNKDETPMQSVTKTGSMLVDGINSLCVKNSGIINKIFDDLKYVYDLNDDLDFENTMHSIRSMMDSIRDDRATVNDTLLKEKETLERKEKEIDQMYKKQRNVLKKERELQKKEFQRERKKLQSKQLLERMTAPQSHTMAYDDDDESLSSLSLESENEQYKSKNNKKVRKKKAKKSFKKTKNLISDL